MDNIPLDWSKIENGFKDNISFKPNKENKKICPLTQFHLMFIAFKFTSFSKN